jgi:hypothetical protein
LPDCTEVGVENLYTYEAQVVEPLKALLGAAAYVLESFIWGKVRSTSVTTSVMSKSLT